MFWEMWAGAKGSKVAYRAEILLRNGSVGPVIDEDKILVTSNFHPQN